jgi:tetraacyldisaccharide 4'-kinase
LLPAGWLREPTDSLRRASYIVLTHTELASDETIGRISRDVARVHGRRPIAATRHLWTALIGPGDALLPLDWLLGRRTLGVCAIGNPRGFEEALRATVGPEALPEILSLPDHDPYRPRTIEKIVSRARQIDAGAIVVTDKDWSKLRRLPEATWPCPVVRPVLSLGFVQGQAELERAIVEAVSSPPIR